MQLPSFRTASLGLIFVIGMASCVACTQVNDIRGKVGLPPVADIGAACETIQPDTAKSDKIRATGDRVVCEAFSGILAFEVAQQTVQHLQAEADGSGDKALIEAAVKAGELEAKASVAAQALNRALDAFVYLNGEVAKYEAEGIPPPSTLLIEAANAYSVMSGKWDEAKPIFDQLGNL